MTRTYKNYKIVNKETHYQCFEDDVFIGCSTKTEPLIQLIWQKEKEKGVNRFINILDFKFCCD